MLLPEMPRTELPMLSASTAGDGLKSGVTRHHKRWSENDFTRQPGAAARLTLVESGATAALPGPVGWLASGSGTSA